MKESRFIAQNKEKWLESEKLLSDSVKDPEKLTNLFTQVVDDLSFSRTYYRNRSVRVYLNKLAREYFSIIYSHQKEKKNRLKIFWLDELPQLIIFSRKQMLISLSVFLLAFSAGTFSAFKDPQFASTILGDQYVAMTKENIKSGDPMAVYKKSQQLDMFLGITLNNLWVAFLTYVMGLFFAIGTLVIVLSNGVMVGCFQYFFIEHDLFAKSALTIWLHGTLEISSIILAGGAGLTLGSGLLFPGTYSRFQSFQISAIRSLKLMLGIAPVIVVAALIESFLTRYTETPDVVKLILIILSFIFIVGYFVIYPWRKSKSGFEFPLVETALATDEKEVIQFERIRNNAAILQESFLFYKRNANKFLPWIFVVSLTVAGANLYTRGIQYVIYGRWIDSLFSNLFLALETSEPAYIFINTLGSSLIFYLVFELLKKEYRKDASQKFQVKAFVQIAIVMSAVYSMLYFAGVWGMVLITCSFLIIMLWSFASDHQDIGIHKGLSFVTRLIGTGFSDIIGLEIILLLLMFSFLLILSAPLVEFVMVGLRNNFAQSDHFLLGIIDFITFFIHIFAFNLLLPLVGAAGAFLYFSLRESESAEKLKDSIATFGAKLTKTGRS